MSLPKPPESPSPDAFQVGPEMWVRVSYEAFDEEGERAEDAPQQISYVHGRGVLLPELEAALDGRRTGASCRVTLRPEQAFGPRRKEAIVELDRDEFPAEVEIGRAHV